MQEQPGINPSIENLIKKPLSPEEKAQFELLKARAETANEIEAISPALSENGGSNNKSSTLTTEQMLAATEKVQVDPKILNPDKLSLSLNSSEKLTQALSGNLDLVEESVKVENKGAGYNLTEALINKPEQFEQEDTAHKT